METQSSAPKSVKELKIGLTLSGGGVRAAVFHLGVLSRLADEQLLENIQMLSTVSGGSLITGLVYRANNYKWPSSAQFPVCFQYVKRQLTAKNLQLRALSRLLLWPWPVITRGRASVFSDAMFNTWNIQALLNDIPSHPRWNINATPIESGKDWRFIPQSRMGDYLLNYTLNPSIKLTDAMCASAAVPILIGSLKIRTAKYKWVQYSADGKEIKPVEPAYKTLHLWDGGAYDNLGVEALFKYKGSNAYREEINFLLVSDGAKEIQSQKTEWYKTNAMRLMDIATDQARALRARSLWNHFNANPGTGAYLKIGRTAAAINKDHGANHPLATNNFNDTKISALKFYPTTLWRMTGADFMDLYKHGREVANASLVCCNPALFHNINI